MTLEQMEDAIKKMAEILIRQHRTFIPDCGGDFSERCYGCILYPICQKSTDLKNLTGQLAAIIEGE